MMRYRKDPLSRRLAITVLVILNVVIIREEYIENRSLDGVSITCFFLALLAIYFMQAGKQQY